VEEGIAAPIHPESRINLGTTWNINDYLDLNLALSYFSSPERENTDTRERVDAKTYVTLNLIGRDVLRNFLSHGSIDVSCCVKNLFNENKRDEINASAFIIDDIPREGRDIFFMLIYYFDKSN